MVTVELQKINKNATLWPFSPSWGIWRIYEWGNRPEWSPGRNSPLLKLFSFFLRTSQCFPFWRRKSKPDFNPGALAVRAECMCQYPSLNLNLFDLNICDQPKNIARITKAVLHKLFGKSSLNIRSVCPASPPSLVCPVCLACSLCPCCPVWCDDHDNHPVYPPCPVWTACGISLQRWLPNVSSIDLFKSLNAQICKVRKLMVVHMQVGGYLI